LRVTFLLLVSSLILFSGCSTRGNPTYTKRVQQPKTTYFKTDNDFVKSALLKEYKKWKGTPYRYGGDSFRGVDCSSFIQQVYYDAFGIKIPRTTKQQAKIGYRVTKANSKSGDLIFFKTGYDTRHTGIIVEKDKFMHTSSKVGVTISSMYNPYWRSKFWKIKRVLP